MDQPVIDIAVGGRFHSDYMMASLLDAGADAHLWTSFPRSQFPLLPTTRIHSLLWPEILYRGLRSIGLENRGDLLKMHEFGKSLAQWLSHSDRSPQTFVGWSSFSLETLQLCRYRTTWLMRDSCHISTQLNILSEEYRKLGLKLPDRSAAIDREEHEYLLADRILVLSRFAKQTFIDKGIPAEKIHLLTLGVDTERFRPREHLLVSGPVRVVYFGSLSVRKGVLYLLEALKPYLSSELQLTLVGRIEPALKPHLSHYSGVRFLPPMKQEKLAEHLQEFDVFVMPTLEDGFGQTVIQAMASGLVPVSTDRCGAAEVITQGRNGWVVPAANSQALRSLFDDLLGHPEQLLAMKEAAVRTARELSWKAYAQQITELLLGPSTPKRASL